jgi:hypothetical protein
MSESKESKNPIDNLKIPEEFPKILNDFISDIFITFPEYILLINKWWNRPCTPDKQEENKQKEVLFLFKHCIKSFPERFFDILYKNEEIFNDDSDVNTEFLPGIVFKQLWNCDISTNTRDTIWKYLQLILFAVIGTVRSSSQLGDTAKMFEQINEEELKSKLEETLKEMQNLFENTKKTGEQSENGNNSTPNPNNINMENMPNASDIQNHINSMMGGKLGKLAMELAEETAKDFNLDVNNTGSAQDVFQSLLQNPNKMMNMVKNIGSKIDDKIKSGEMKETEIMEEGLELLNKMKDMPGMGDIQKMFTQMGIPGLGKNAKLNVPAMEAQLQRNMKNAKMKERLRAKAQKNQQMNINMQNSQIPNVNIPTLSEEELIKCFETENSKPKEKTTKGKKVKK